MRYPAPDRAGLSTARGQGSQRVRPADRTPHAAIGSSGGGELGPCWRSESDGFVEFLAGWLCSRKRVLGSLPGSVPNLGVVGQPSDVMGGVQVADLLLRVIAVEVDQLVLTDAEVRVAVRPGAVSAACSGCGQRSSKVHCYYQGLWRIVRSPADVYEPNCELVDSSAGTITMPVGRSPSRYRP